MRKNPKSSWALALGLMWPVTIACTILDTLLTDFEACIVWGRVQKIPADISNRKSFPTENSKLAVKDWGTKHQGKLTLAFRKPGRRVGHPRGHSTYDFSCLQCWSGQLAGVCWELLAEPLLPSVEAHVPALHCPRAKASASLALPYLPRGPFTGWL